MSGRLVARYYDPRFGRFLQQDPLPDVVEQARARAVAAFSYEALSGTWAAWSSPEFEARESKLAAITESGEIGNKLRAFEWLREEVSPREATGSTFANNAGGAARKENVKRAPSLPTGTPRDTSAHLADPGAEARPSAIVPSAGIAPWDPDVWNLYAYCSDNPLVNTDPDGKIVREQWKQKSVELLQTGKTWDWVKAAGIHVGLATLEVFSLGTFGKNDELSDRYLAGEINESQYKSGMAINGGVALGSLAVGGGTGALASRAVAGVGSKLVQGALIGGAAGFGASTTEVMGTRAGYGVAGIEYRGTAGDDARKIAIATVAGGAIGALVGGAAQATTTRRSLNTGTKPQWLQEVEAGQNFNKARTFDYPYREIYVERPGGGYYRLDAYEPGRSIVSRKLTQFSEITEKSGIRYVNEVANKYPVGARIANVPSSGPLAGQRLSGDLILEVPAQIKPTPRSVMDAANSRGVIIRDVYGGVFK